ncbi:unnamed protein product [Cyprideis torosa]|uniref:Uncharacterized protein n=1 Tax=Cyprideis torosa TaxID=163714 RepID=A0A7R8ZQY8_9CRUS|nr:unnamed protein product [Cyprideis torosa]CAG0902488.1 unnamed protein product [Cyprideis torosa]
MFGGVPALIVASTSLDTSYCNKSTSLNKAMSTFPTSTTNDEILAPPYDEELPKNFDGEVVECKNVMALMRQDYKPSTEQTRTSLMEIPEELSKSRNSSPIPPSTGFLSVTDTDNAAVDGSTLDGQSASLAEPAGQMLQIVPTLPGRRHGHLRLKPSSRQPYFRHDEISFAECVIPRRETGTDRPTLPKYPVAHPYVECIDQSFDYISQVPTQMQPLDFRISRESPEPQIMIQSKIMTQSQIMTPINVERDSSYRYLFPVL